MLQSRGMTAQPKKEYRTRSFRMDDETYEALMTAVRNQSGRKPSFNQLMRAMFVGEPNGGTNANPDMIYSRDGYMEGGRAGGGVSESMRDAIAERQRLDPDAPHLIVGVIENTPPLNIATGREAMKERGPIARGNFCAECRHVGGGHQRGCSMLKPPQGKTGDGQTFSELVAAENERQSRIKTVYGDGSGYIGVIEPLPPSQTLNADEATTIRVHGDIKDLKYEPVNE